MHHCEVLSKRAVFFLKHTWVDIRRPRLQLQLCINQRHYTSALSFSNTHLCFLLRSHANVPIFDRVRPSHCFNFRSSTSTRSQPCVQTPTCKVSTHISHNAAGRSRHGWAFIFKSSKEHHIMYVLPVICFDFYSFYVAMRKRFKNKLQIYNILTCVSIALLTTFNNSLHTFMCFYITFLSGRSGTVAKLHQGAKA